MPVFCALPHCPGTIPPISSFARGMELVSNVSPLSQDKDLSGELQW